MRYQWWLSILLMANCASVFYTFRQVAASHGRGGAWLLCSPGHYLVVAIFLKVCPDWPSQWCHEGWKPIKKGHFGTILLWWHPGKVENVARLTLRHGGNALYTVLCSPTSRKMGEKRERGMAALMIYSKQKKNTVCRRTQAKRTNCERCVLSVKTKYYSAFSLP